MLNAYHPRLLSSTRVLCGTWYVLITTSLPGRLGILTLHVLSSLPKVHTNFQRSLLTIWRNHFGLFNFILLSCPVRFSSKWFPNSPHGPNSQNIYVCLHRYGIQLKWLSPFYFSYNFRVCPHGYDIHLYSNTPGGSCHHSFTHTSYCLSSCQHVSSHITSQLVSPVWWYKIAGQYTSVWRQW